jgi:hypothetical protein
MGDKTVIKKREVEAMAAVFFVCVHGAVGNSILFHQGFGIMIIGVCASHFEADMTVLAETKYQWHLGTDGGETHEDKNNGPEQRLRHASNITVIRDFVNSNQWPAAPLVFYILTTNHTKYTKKNCPFCVIRVVRG